MNIIKVPERFNNQDMHPFPPKNQGQLIEQYAKGYFAAHQSLVKGDWAYIPIFWLAHLSNHNYENEAADADTIPFLNSLPLGRKYFTVVQSSKMSEALQATLKNLGCAVFSAGGIPGTIPIPLACGEHVAVRKEDPRFLASFVGSLKTHPCRREMYDAFRPYGDCYVTESTNQNEELFKHIMADSVFALCPRGYGPTSFRLYEAMQMGCVPVYITDVDWRPFKRDIPWDDTAVFWPIDRMKSLHVFLESITPSQRKAMQYNAVNYYRGFCTCYSTCVQIIKELEVLDAPDLSGGPGVREDSPAA